MGQPAETMTPPPVQHVAQQALQKVRSVCDRMQILSLNRQLEACEGLLVENPLIDVAVLGQFKAGKSSFVNSLVGRDVLPVGVIPVTTVITRLRFGERERAVITFYDGTTKEIPVSALDEYTSEAKNPSNEKNVETVDIELPGLADYAGLRLVDTPGLGSVFKAHMEVSANWLPEAGAAVLAVSADRPLSENDLQLIRELTQYTPRIILLLTKADLLTPSQQEEVVRFFEDTLKRELNREFPIYLYSTKTETVKFRQRLEAELFFKLALNRDFEFRKILQHKANSVIRGCLGYLELALKTSLQADEDRESLRQQILDERVSFESMREQLFFISRENQKQTRVFIMNILQGLMRPLWTDVMQRLEAEMKTWRGNLWQLTRRYEQWVADTMTEEMRRVSKKEHRHFCGTLKKAHAGLARSLEAFRVILNGNVQKVLGVSLAEAEWDIRIAEPEQPDIRTFRASNYNLDLIWFLIPMFLFRRAFEKRFLEKIPWEVETNINRLAAQWEDRINAAIDGMQKQAVQYVRDETATIESLLSSARGRTDEIRRMIAELQAISERLAKS
ncbi:MAG TPA: dynamin family protein [Syntrophales bacterium]|nr:dynamin family protein [Syntrophobacterales bacterium]HQL91426.1 dynamin family protein [Syntrophales bacterium]